MDLGLLRTIREICPRFVNNNSGDNDHRNEKVERLLGFVIYFERTLALLTLLSGIRFLFFFTLNKIYSKPHCTDISALNPGHMCGSFPF